MPGSLTSNGTEDLVSSVRRLVSADQCSHDPEPGEKLLLTPSLRVVPEAVPAVAPLILTGSDLAPDEALLVDADWEEPIWSAPEAPLAEIALGVEEAELVAEAPMWPEVEEDALQGAGPVVAFPFAAAFPEPEPEPDAEPDAEDEDEIDVADVLTAAVLEDENLRVMDEAELHDLVREIVRQELQGSLGERITRNVRKQVRAEVNRALAARALD